MGRVFDRNLLGDRVRDARELAGITQAELASLSGVTAETISRMERGLFDPTTSTLIAVADALDRDLDYLVGRWDHSEEIPHSVTGLKLMRCIDRMDAAGQHAILRLLDQLAYNGSGDAETEPDPDADEAEGR